MRQSAVGAGVDELEAGEMRTATNDEHARAWFRRYWTVGIGSGAHVLVNALLDVVREDAERRSGSSSGGQEHQPARASA